MLPGADPSMGQGETRMPSKTKMALATLLVLGSASVVLADSNDRTDHHGSAALRAVSVTMSNDHIKGVNHAVKPFTAEEKAWFAGPQLGHVQSAITGRTMAWIKLTEPGGKPIHINVEHVTSVRSTTLIRGAESQLDLASGKFQGVQENVDQVIQLIAATAGDQIADIETEP